MVSARPEIYYNVQSIREAHEKFLNRVRSLIPTYNLSRMQIERVMRPHAVDLSARAFPGRSLRTQNLKVLVDRRLKELASEVNEALIVAREIGCLVRRLPTFAPILILSLDCSQGPSYTTKSSVRTMNS